MAGLTIGNLFFLELGWFLFFFLLLILFFWRAVQRKIIKVREAISLRLNSIGVFIKDEGYDANLQLYKFRFKDTGVKPYHVYSPLPWSSIQALYLSAEIMIIEHLYPFLTMRTHKLNPRQYFADPLICPPRPGFKNTVKRIIFGIVSLIPKANDKAWEWIDRDVSVLTKEISVLESDIPTEAIEYLYRVEYEERVLNPETETFITHIRTSEWNVDEIEDAEEESSIAVHRIEPLYAVILKEEDEEITKVECLHPDKIKEFDRRVDVKITKRENAHEVDYFTHNPPDSGKGVFPETEVEQMKDNSNYEIKRDAVLKTVRYTITPEERRKQVQDITEVLPSDRIEEMRKDAKYNIISVTEGPQYITYSYVERKLRKEVNLSKREIAELRTDPNIKIINVDETMQARRVRSFKENPEQAVSLYITHCNALAVQKMKGRQIASEKAKIQRQLVKAQERLFETEVESAKKETDYINKTINLFQRSHLVLDKVLADVFQGSVAGMSPDQIKRQAHRDFEVIMNQLSDGQPAEHDWKTEIQKIGEKIKELERSQDIRKSRQELERTLEEEFPQPIEEM